MTERIDALEAAVKAVVELHQPAGEKAHRCRVCDYAAGWPCDTRRALAPVTQEAS